MSNSLIGNLLVASTLVHDPVLSKAVCLIVHQDETGFIGVMLNRPLQPNPQAMVQMLGQSTPNSDRDDQPHHHRIPDLSRPMDETEAPSVDDSAMNDSGMDNSGIAGYSTDATNDASLYDETSFEDGMISDELLEESGASESAVEQALASAVQSLGMVHFGGPLSGPVVAIHGSSEYAEAETARGVYLAAQKPNLEGLVSQDSDPYRLIVGHLGWEADQLQAEFEAGYWHMIPATTDAVFSQDQEMWSRLIRRATANSMARWIGTPDVPMSYEVN